MSLVPQRILRISELNLGREVMVPNSSNAIYVRDRNGRSWIRREAALMGDNGIQAEALWWLLAKHLDVPVPEAAFHCDSDNDGWLSERVEEVVHWSPSLASYVTNLDGLGGILALDAITGNSDRHSRNLLLETISDSRLHAWAIDAANAAVGRAMGVEQLGLDSPEPHPDLTGIPVDLVTPGALEVAQALSSASGAVLSELVHEACTLARADASERTRLLDALGARCAVASQITKGYLTKLGSLTP